MRNNRYRRLRAMEVANRDFLAGKSISDNPFPEDTLEHRIYAKAMVEHISYHDDMEEMFEIHGHGDKMPTLKSPDSICVRPPLPGYP